MLSFGGSRREYTGIKSFLVGICREEVLVIKDQVRSTDGFGREANEKYLVFCL